MNKIVLTVLACALAVVACSHLREPTDAQLGTLLRSDRADPADANAALDKSAVDCLSAWSGDADLAKDLPVRLSSPEGRTACRGSLEAWIGDGARNPDKFTFAEISTPKVARRARDLQRAREVAALGDPSRQKLPPAFTRSAVAPLAKPDPNVDLGAAGEHLKQAEDLCLQAQQNAAASNAAAGRLAAFAKFCSGNLAKLRTTMEQVARSGQNTQRLDVLATNADNIANAARRVLAEPPPAPAPAR
ncbi:MAG TPA: hypothetical protein VGC30_08810 [Dokdonella sp.]